MKVVGSVIARLGSKRLNYKNLLPYKGVPLVVRALNKMVEFKSFDQIVVSTDSELIARTCMELSGVAVLRRPPELALDTTPSIPVFQHIVDHFPCDVHLNYNCNFPECPIMVFEQAIDLACRHDESLSVPYAVWAQTSKCLKDYGDPFNITAKKFDAQGVFATDIHTMDDLLSVHRSHQPELAW